MLQNTSWTFALSGTTRWHWSSNLESVQLPERAEKHNHLPAIYIWMSNSTVVPALRVKVLESEEEHFLPT